MITVKLMGGLGNQMFQYAAARQLAEQHNTDVQLDLTSLLDRRSRTDHVFRNYDLHIFKISENFTVPFLLTKFIGSAQSTPLIYRLSKYNKNNKHIFAESHFNYHSEINQLPDNTYLSGYWQSPKYFSDIEDVIKKAFTFKKPLSPIASELSKQILNTEAVCINVRRGDFVHLKTANAMHGVLPIEYYHHAINLIAEKINTPHFFIFSDDIEWCTENIKSPYPLTIVNHDYAGKKFKDYLQLMICCKHFIIPNSTFAWWAAWLNTHKEKIVIAPQNWFQDKKLNAETFDLMPENWMRI